jgi:branched-chain amino acid aminotransferase
MTEYICYHNGEFKKNADVCISFLDLGFQRAYGVFDYLRTYKQIPFQKEWHADKLINSIKEMNIEIDLTRSDFLVILENLFLKNNDSLFENMEYGVRTIVTGGVDNIPTIIMYIEELDDHYFALQKKGISLLAKRAPRQSAGSKNIDYKTLMSSKKELEEKNCLEILHRGDTYVYESGTSNIFMIKDNVIITPKEKVYCGSTRKLVLDIALENNIRTQERFITWNEFIQADEVFISASKKEILPVVRIYNEREIFDFKIGETTKKLIELFNIKKQD